MSRALSRTSPGCQKPVCSARVRQIRTAAAEELEHTHEPGPLSERTSVDVSRRYYSLSPAKGNPMFVSNNDILWSASDLTRAAECEFSLLRQLDVKLGRIPAAKTAVDPLMDRIAEIGLEHEARELTRLSKGLAPYGVATGRGVCLIDYPKPYTAALLTESPSPRR